MRYLIDTSFMVGLANPKDKYFKDANNIFEEISENGNSEVFISDYVLMNS